MSGAPGIETAIAGSHTEFVLARAGTPRHQVPAGQAGGARDIMRLPACVPLLIATGGRPSITVRETFVPMSVASLEKTAVFAVRGAIAPGLTGATSRATVAKGPSAMIVVKSLMANAAIIAVKITSARSAVIAALTFAASGGAIMV